MSLGITSNPEESSNFSIKSDRVIEIKDGFSIIKPFAGNKIATLTFNRQKIIIYDEDFHEIAQFTATRDIEKSHIITNTEITAFECLGKTWRVLVFTSDNYLRLVHIGLAQPKELLRYNLQKFGLSSVLFLEKNLFLTTDSKEKFRIWNCLNFKMVSTVNCQKKGPPVSAIAFNSKEKYIAISFIQDSVILFFHLYKKNFVIKIDLQRRGLHRINFFFLREFFIGVLTLSEIGIWKLNNKKEYEYQGKVKTEGALTKDTIISEKFGLLASIKKYIRLYNVPDGTLKESIELKAGFEPGKIFFSSSSNKIIVQNQAGNLVNIIET